MSDDRLMTRWLTFNGVGVLGMVLQLSTLAALVHLAGLPYLLATLLAVEAAVLHNFAWHQRWTWRDRPTGSASALAARLARFHALNGAVSLGGNLAIMWLLAGRAGINPVVANLIAIAACSLVNFAASHRLVFAGAGPRRAKPVAAAIISLSVVQLGAAGGSEPPVLQQGTLAAWQAYERRVDERYSGASAERFFAGDVFGSAGWRLAAAGGATPMFQVRSPGPGQPEPEVPDGRIHHWVGAIFVPGLSVADAVGFLQSHAGQESKSYDDVIASRLIDRDGDRITVFLKLRRTKIITATYNTEHSVVYRRVSPQRASSRSVATRIAELADAGTPSEHEKAPGTDSGYLWRLNAYWRFEQAAGGVLIECESVSLSRNIPSLLRPFVSGVVEGVARESLEKTLVSLRRTMARPS